MSIGFPARYAGRCGNCDESFAPGDEVFYAPPDETLTGVECCGHVSESRPATPEVTLVDQVMPRGKTAKDRCDRCFIVHTPGQTGCE